MKGDTVLTERDRRGFQAVVRAISKLRQTDPGEARQLEIEFCSQILKDEEARPAPADFGKKSRVKMGRVNLLRVLAGEIGIENIVSIDREPLIAELSHLVH